MELIVFKNNVLVEPIDFDYSDEKLKRDLSSRSKQVDRRLNSGKVIARSKTMTNDVSIGDIVGYSTLDGVSGEYYTNRNSSIESNLDTKYDIDFFGWNPLTVGLPAPGTYGQGLTFVSSGIAHNNSNNWITQLGFSTSSKAYFRTKVNSGPWGSWSEFYHTGNFTPSDYLNKTTGGTITGKVTVTSLNTTPITFANLPASPSIGDIATITDATLLVIYRGVASGGGSNVALVMYDGTNWIYH